MDRKEYVRLYNLRPDVKERKRLYAKTPKMIAARKRWKQKNKNYWRDYMRKYNLKNIEKVKKQKSDNYFKYKKLVIDYYTQNEVVCMCESGMCHVMGYSVLTVDHINGGGTKHTKSISKNFYKWIVDNDYPEDFQILCFNCNCTKGHSTENKCYHFQ